MKNFIRRLERRKGFTLIECLIALTVFAALTLVVFAILTNARMATVQANDTEENLTKLINNVVSDESFVRYSAANADDMLTLKLSTGGTDFRVSYSEIDGYKNYVLCPTAACQHFADNTEFMDSADKESFAQTKYKCPKCSTEITQVLVCEECGNKADHTDKTSFTYIPSNGGYCCNDCGSTAVRGEIIDETVISNYDLNVKTLVPNAIVYGTVTRPVDEAAANSLFYVESSTGTQTSSNVNMALSYEAGPNVTVPGTYTLEVSSDMDDIDFVIDIRLPGGYRLVSTHAINGDCLAMTDSTGNPYLHFTGCDKYAKSKVEFQLVNEKSGLSFEEDYNNPGDASASGLKGYWFYMTTANKNFTSPG